jgi:hypothetical protein
MEGAEVVVGLVDVDMASEDLREVEAAPLICDEFGWGGLDVRA